MHWQPAKASVIRLIIVESINVTLERFFGLAHPKSPSKRFGNAMDRKFEYCSNPEGRSLVSIVSGWANDADVIGARDPQDAFILRDIKHVFGQLVRE